MSRNNFFEPLESRQLRSVSLGGGVLTVTGTNNADAITFELDKIGSGMVYRSELVVNDNGAVSRFSLSSTLPGAQINSITVAALGGNDSVQVIDGGDGILTKPIYVDAGAGNDTVITGGGNDTVYGASGNDSLTTNDGGDTVWGDEGLDSLFGNEGGDVLHGGCDADEIHGGNGNDSCYGEDGNDVIQGGANNDYLSGGDDNDDITGNNGADVLLGDGGNDTLTAGGDGEVDTMTGGSGADIFYTDVTETTYYVHSGGMEYTLHAYDYEDVITDDTASDEIRDM